MQGKGSYTHFNKREREMGLGGKISAAVEVDSSADHLYEIFSGKAHHHVPNASDRIPEVYMHDDSPAGTHGSLRNWTYVAAGKVEKWRERTTLDEKNRVVTLEAVEGDPLKIYKSYVGSYSFDPNPKGQGTLAKFSVVYEKLNPEAPDPFHYVEMVVKIIRDVDAHLAKA